MKALPAISFWRFTHAVLAAAAALCIGLLLGGAPLRIALAEGVVCGACLLGGGMAVLGAVRAYPIPAGIKAYALLVGVVVAGAAWWLDATLVGFWLRGTGPIGPSWLTGTAPVRVATAFLLFPALGLVEALSKGARELAGRFTAQAQTERSLRDAELFKLRQQFQPHFLYNSLNSINALIALDPRRAQQMVGTLSDYLRRSVRTDGTEAVPLHEELDHLQAYLAIEAVRFGDRLDVQTTVDANVNRLVPPFLLQPLVENAVKFGVYGTTGPVAVRFTAAQSGSDLLLTLQNPFDPLSRPPRGTGFGLQGLQRRLELLYGRADLLQTKTDDHLFTATLRIPATL